jgi:hypothetical protein
MPVPVFRQQVHLLFALADQDVVHFSTVSL